MAEQSVVGDQTVQLPSRETEPGSGWFSKPQELDHPECGDLKQIRTDTSTTIIQPLPRSRPVPPSPRTPRRQTSREQTEKINLAFRELDQEIEKEIQNLQEQSQPRTTEDSPAARVPSQEIATRLGSGNRGRVPEQENSEVREEKECASNGTSVNPETDVNLPGTVVPEPRSSLLSENEGNSEPDDSMLEFMKASRDSSEQLKINTNLQAFVEAQVAWAWS